MWGDSLPEEKKNNKKTKKQQTNTKLFPISISRYLLPTITKITKLL